MKFLIYGINYHPELTGIGKYTTEMCEWLAEHGQNVTVITANPYYPEWKILKGYKNGFSKEKINGVTVLRCPLYVPKNVTGLTRIFHEISFIMSSFFLWFRILFVSKFDFVFCIAPPFHSGIFGMVYKFIRGGKLIYHIQDLQVDAAHELKLVKNKNLLKFFRWIERSIMLKVDILSTISSGMAIRIKKKNINQETVYVMPNWVDIEFVKPKNSSTSFRNKLGFNQSDFIVLYSGNLGEKQGLEMIIEAANSLKENKQIKFSICGSGAYKNTLIELASASQLENVFFEDLQPYELLPELLNAADVHLVLQKRATADLVLPSKLTGIAASGGYSIVTADPGTTLYNEVDQHRIGTIIPPEDSESLINAIADSFKQDLAIYKKNARRYAETHLNKDVILQSFLNKLEALNGKESIDYRDNRTRRGIFK